MVLGDAWPCVRCDAGLRNRASSSFLYLLGSRTWLGQVCNYRKALPRHSTLPNQCRCTQRHTPTGIAERHVPGIRVNKEPATAGERQHKWSRNRDNGEGNLRVRGKVHAMLARFGKWQLLTTASDASFSP